jgi:pSer/pThr/pTyr-binding forkhead associated (FHA) protein
VPPVILTLLQWLFLLLLYVFVARAVRAVVRDLSPARPTAGRPVQPPRAQQRQAAQAASKPAQRRAKTPPRELVVHHPGGRPTVHALTSDELILGRDAGCTVPLSDAYASERHARVSRDDNGWVLVDLGSTNGTYLNQVKVTSPRPLAPGDQIGIGKTVVEVRK